MWQAQAEQYKVLSISDHIHQFCPLVTEYNYQRCSLDILFLRRDMPGGLVMHGGDIDNRIKVLLDALRMPLSPKEVQDAPQDPSQSPCFCLLADDKYIDQLSVTTDRLLTPQEGGESLHDVVLVVRVEVGLFDRRFELAPI